MSKLKSIAEIISEYLYNIFGIVPIYEFEKEFVWLTTHPDPRIFSSSWKTICNTYDCITDGLFDLQELSKHPTYKLANESQYVDLWFSKPFDFIVEFDEKPKGEQLKAMKVIKENKKLNANSLFPS